jgi:hypothetical protein
MRITGDPENGFGYDFFGKDLKELDEIFIGNWLHLERMNGVDSRFWCLIIRNEKGENLNITINEKRGKVVTAFIYENEWEHKDFNPYLCSDCQTKKTCHQCGKKK